MRLTGMVRRIAVEPRRGGWRRMLPVGVVLLTVLGTLAGLLVAVLSRRARASHGRGPGTVPAAAPPSVASVRPSTGNAPVVARVPLTLGAGARLLPGSSIAGRRRRRRAEPAVAPLRRTRPGGPAHRGAVLACRASLLAAGAGCRGWSAAERIEAVRMLVNGAPPRSLGVDPSQFRAFAAPADRRVERRCGRASRTAASRSPTRWATWTRSRSAAPCTAAGRTRSGCRVVAFGTLGIGGVDAVVSDATARALGAPAGNAIVVSVAAGGLHRRLPPPPGGCCRGGRRRAARLAGQHRRPAPAAGAAGAGHGRRRRCPQTALDAMLGPR